MRYYRVVITSPEDGKVFVPNVFGIPGFSKQDPAQYLWSYCSLNTGATIGQIGGNNPGALRVELDISSSYMHLPIQNSNITIHGVSIAELSQAANLNGMNIAIYGGMSRGLPLANPAQAQLLVSGQISPAFGNWVGTSQYLSLTVIYGGSSPSSNQTSGNPNFADTPPVPATNVNPANIVWQWSRGQQFLDAIVTTLSVAFPKYRVAGSVNPNIVWDSNSADTGFFSSLQQFGQYINRLTQRRFGGALPDPALYPGVALNLRQNTITVDDGTTLTKPKVIAFQDLRGQPVWSGPNLIQITTVLRGDISAGDYVKLPYPPGVQQSLLGLTRFGSGSQYFNPQAGNHGYSSQKSGSIFSGTYRVTQVRHVGDSRNPNGLSWVTTIDCYLASKASDAAQAVDALPLLYNGSDRFTFYLPT